MSRYIAGVKDAVAHQGLDLTEMLAASLVALGIVADVRRFERQLSGDEGEHRRRRLLVLA